MSPHTTFSEKIGFLVILAVVGFSVWVTAEAGEKYYGVGSGTAIFYSVGAVGLAMGLAWLIIARLHTVLTDRIRRQTAQADQLVAKQDYGPTSGASA